MLCLARELDSVSVSLSRFMPTSRRIVQFSDGIPAPPGARVVYIDGAFDMFHPGHIDILKVRSSGLEWHLVFKALHNLGDGTSP